MRRPRRRGRRQALPGGVPAARLRCRPAPVDRHGTSPRPSTPWSPPAGSARYRGHARRRHPLASRPRPLLAAPALCHRPRARPHPRDRPPVPHPRRPAHRAIAGVPMRGFGSLRLRSRIRPVRRRGRPQRRPEQAGALRGRRSSTCRPRTATSGSRGLRRAARSTDLRAPRPVRLLPALRRRRRAARGSCCSSATATISPSTTAPPSSTSTSAPSVSGLSSASPTAPRLGFLAPDERRAFGFLDTAFAAPGAEQ